MSNGLYAVGDLSAQFYPLFTTGWYVCLSVALTTNWIGLFVLICTICELIDLQVKHEEIDNCLKSFSKNYYIKETLTSEDS